MLHATMGTCQLGVLRNKEGKAREYGHESKIILKASKEIVEAKLKARKEIVKGNGKKKGM